MRTISEFVISSMLFEQSRALSFRKNFWPCEQSGWAHGWHWNLPISRTSGLEGMPFAKCSPSAYSACVRIGNTLKDFKTNEQALPSNEYASIFCAWLN